MPSVLTSPSPVSGASRSRRGLSGVAVLGELEQLHGTLQAGDQFPSVRELVRRFDASERAVGWALDELARQGKIIKRLGRGGTFVAEFSPQANGYASNGVSMASKNGVKNGIQSRTIVAISEPDGSIFDRALQLLARHPDATQLAINCRLMQHEDAVSFGVPSEDEKPLGYIVFGKLFAPLAQKLQAAGHRVVLIGSPPTDAPVGVPNVYCDHQEGGHLIVRHLLEQGHRNFLFQGAPDFHQHARWRGAQQALSVFKDQIKYDFLSDTQLLNWMKEPASVHEFFRRPEAPTALVAWNDHKAVQLLTLLNRVGVRIPEDVSLVGYDDLPQGATLTPALTTVDSSIERQLNTALRLLTELETASSHHTVVVLPSLVRRDSSAPISG